MLELHLRPVLDTSYQKVFCVSVEAVDQNSQDNGLPGLSINLR